MPRGPNGTTRVIGRRGKPAWARSNWQSYAIRVAAPACQRPFMQRLLDEGIATRRGVMNVHREAAYPAGTWREAPGGLATGEQIQDTGVILPLYHDLDEVSQDRVIESVIRAVRSAC